MRHQVRKTKLGNSKEYTKAVLRNMLTSLLEHGKIETTEKRAKIIKKYMDKLIGKTSGKDAKNAARVVDKTVYTRHAKNQFRKFQESFNKSGSNVRMTKIRKRPGDNATIVRVELLKEKK
jgi:large subunit ribosomal protein L17